MRAEATLPPGWWALAAAPASAALLAVSAVGPAWVGWLAWVALVPAAAVALAARGTRLGRAVVPLTYALYLEALLVPALPFGLTEGQWGDPVLPVLVGDSPVLVVALVLVPTAGAVLYLVRFGSAPALPPPAWAAWAAVVVPAAAWTALDLVRLRLDPGGLWGPLFASQQGTAAAHLAEPLGPLLLTFLMVAVAYAIALALVRGRAGVAPVVGAAATVLAAALAAAADRPASERTVRVAAVQPGYDTAEDDLAVLRWFPTDHHDRASLDLVADLGGLTERAARRGAQVVVWPEATVWAHRDRRVRAALARLARRTRTAVVVPWFDPDPDHGGTVVVRPDGTFTAEQPKQRPMWFLGEQGGNRRPPRPVRVRAGAIGTLLGVDNQTPALARRLVGAGATLLASSTHDWREMAPRQRALARLHATALEVPLVRADWRYGSAIYGRDGAVLADAGGNKRRTVLVADVAISSAASSAAR